MDSGEYERSKCTLAQMSDFLAAYSKERESLIARNVELEHRLKESEEKNKKSEATSAAVTVLMEKEKKSLELIKSIDDIKKRFDEQFKDFHTATVENNASTTKLDESQNKANEPPNFTESTMDMGDDTEKLDESQNQPNEPPNAPKSTMEMGDDTAELDQSKNKQNESSNAPESTMEMDDDTAKLGQSKNQQNEPPNFTESTMKMGDDTAKLDESQNKPNEPPNVPESTLEMGNDTVTINTKIPTRPKRKRKALKKRKPSFLSTSNYNIDTLMNDDFSFESNTPKKQIICKVCESENRRTINFKTRNALNDHLTKAHPNTAPFYFRCPDSVDGCKSHFATKKGIITHTRLSHWNGNAASIPPNTSKSKPLICSVCHEEYFSYRLYEKHKTKCHAGTSEGRESTYLTNLKETTDAVSEPSTYNEAHLRNILSTEHEEPTSSEKTNEPTNITSVEFQPVPSTSTGNPTGKNDSGITSVHEISSSIQNSDAGISTQVLEDYNLKVWIKRETLLDDPLNCCCGFSSSDGNDMASHLLNCDGKIAYSNAETAAQHFVQMQDEKQDSNEVSNMWLKTNPYTNNKSVIKIAEVVLKELPYEGDNYDSNPGLKVTVLNSNHSMVIQQNNRNIDPQEVDYEIIELSDDE